MRPTKLRARGLPSARHAVGAPQHIRTNAAICAPCAPFRGLQLNLQRWLTRAGGAPRAPLPGWLAGWNLGRPQLAWQWLSLTCVVGQRRLLAAARQPSLPSPCQGMIRKASRHAVLPALLLQWPALAPQREECSAGSCCQSRAHRHTRAGAPQPRFRIRARGAHRINHGEQVV